MVRINERICTVYKIRNLNLVYVPTCVLTLYVNYDYASLCTHAFRAIIVFFAWCTYTNENIIVHVCTYH